MHPDDDTCAEMINIEIAYAEAEQQKIERLQVAKGTSLGEALRYSQMNRLFPHLDLDTADCGIFGREQGRDTPLREGDRIELYRPLRVDAKTIAAAKAKRRQHMHTPD